MIRMCVLCVLVIMLILAPGSCIQYEVVDVTEGGNAILNFTASGLTIFYKMHCEKQTKITLTVIGQYCGPADNCSTSSRTPEVSIETGRLIVQNVTYNRCYSAKTIRGHREIFYNVTVKKLHFTISAEMSISKFTTETPDHTLTSDNSYDTTSSSAITIIAIVVTAAAVISVVLFVVWYIRTPAEVCTSECKCCCSVMLAKVPHEEIIMGNPAAANSLLTTVNETQL